MKITDILPSKHYHKSILFLTQIALQSQYRNSFLGLAWSMITPAIMIAIMSLAFSLVMRISLKDYTLYLMSGMLAWNMMTSIITASANALLARGEVLKRAVIPKTIFIISDAIVHIYIFLLSFIAMQIVIGVFISGFIHPTVILLPIAMLPLAISSIFAGLAIAYITPYMRDAEHLVTVALNSIYWATPIIYPLSMIPEDKRIFFEYNPFYILIRPIQEVVYFGRIPSLYEIVTALLVTIIAMIASVIICCKLRRNIIYYL